MPNPLARVAYTLRKRLLCLRGLMPVVPGADVGIVQTAVNSSENFVPEWFDNSIPRYWVHTLDEITMLQGNVFQPASGQGMRVSFALLQNGLQA